jgi:anti-sigma factor RsiW
MKAKEQMPNANRKSDSLLPPASTRCPTDEILLAHLLGETTGEERHRIDGHLGSCDACLIALTAAQHRISISDEVNAPVPAAVAERAATRNFVPASESVTPARLTDWRARLSQRFTLLSRLPILVPTAVAAGALLTLALQQTLLQPGPRELTRAVALSQTLPVTVPDAPVRAEPSTRADLIATLPRGAEVKISGEIREWYRVKTPSGRDGWIERRMFE